MPFWAVRVGVAESFLMSWMITQGQHTKLLGASCV